MSQVSLFRKWRSKAFADLVGQESVVKTLRNVLAGGSPARAYLFCGPRGTGKTSTARIFAKALCCENGPALEPCNQCSTCREITQGNCLDVFEIDAASNTQVDKIRDFIVDKVHFAPARARYKVYIIDEVHKLSSSSFNALLKTLEEPPAHVVFVLATTHPHELLPTILSRCQRHDFRAFSLLELEKHLCHIAAEEGMQLEPAAAALLARSAQGSMRDALVMLEQAQQFCGNEVTQAEMVSMLGLLPHETLAEWVRALSTGDASSLLGAVEHMHRAGQDFVRVVDLWVDHLRLLMLTQVKAFEAGVSELPEAYRDSLMLQSSGVSRAQVLNWLKSAVDLQQAIRDGQPARISLELSLVSLCTPAAATTLDGLARQVHELQERVNALATGAPISAAAAGSPHAAAPQAPAAFKAPAPERPAPTRAPEPVKVPTEQFRVPAEILARSQEAATPAPTSAPAPERVAVAVTAPRPEQPPELARPEEPRPPEVRPSPPPAAKPPIAAISPTSAPDPKKFWPTFLEQIRQRDKRLLAVLNDVKVREISPERIAVSIPPNYKFHLDFLQKSVRVLEEVSGDLMQSKPRFEVTVDGAQVQPPQDQEHDTLVKKAHGLFGGRILDAAKEGSAE